MHVTAIIQARLGSQRLPGKVLKPIGKHASLYHTIRRTQEAVEDVRVCVPHTDKDLITACRAWGVPVIAGPERDVLWRYQMAAQRPPLPDIVVRITGDCPLVDPDLVRRVVGRCELGYDYASNVWPDRTFPEGLDVEAFGAHVLRTAAYSSVARDYDKEHVTPLIRQLAVRSDCVRQKDSLAHHRWTLDTEDDYAFFQALAEWLDFEPPHPTTAEVLDLLALEPKLALINRKVAHA